MQPCPDSILPSADRLHDGFLAILSRIQLHATIFFRHLPCPHAKEDAIAETLAVAWKWYVRAAEQGKNPAEFVTALATYAAKHVKSGRKLCGQEKAKDVLSPTAQARHSFSVSKLPDFETLSVNPLMEALHDNSQTPIPDQVCFRLDFPAWCITRSERDCRMIEDLILGERTLDVSRKVGLSPGRISQLRREFHGDWERFCGNEVV